MEPSSKAQPETLCKDFFREGPLLPPYTALLLYLAVLAVYLVAGLFLQTHLDLLGVFLNQVFFLLVPSALVSQTLGKKINDWPYWELPSFLQTLGILAFTFFLSWVIDQCIAWQDLLWPPPDTYTTTFHKLIQISSAREGSLKALILVLTPAICEEIFFRGLLQPSWVKRFGKTIGILFTSLSFALAHGNLFYLHYYLILGFYLGWLFNRKRNLWFCVIAHAANNAWALFSQFSPF